MPYTVNFQKSFKDTIQGDGRQFYVETENEFSIHEVKPEELPMVIVAIQEKGYLITSIVQQYAPRDY